jgi:hypothetical protein
VTSGEQPSSTQNSSSEQPNPKPKKQGNQKHSGFSGPFTVRNQAQNVELFEKYKNKDGEAICLGTVITCNKPKFTATAVGIAKVEAGTETKPDSRAAVFVCDASNVIQTVAVPHLLEMQKQQKFFFSDPVALTKLQRKAAKAHYTSTKVSRPQKLRFTGKCKVKVKKKIQTGHPKHPKQSVCPR